MIPASPTEATEALYDTPIARRVGQTSCRGDFTAVSPFVQIGQARGVTDVLQLAVGAVPLASRVQKCSIMTISMCELCSVSGGGRGQVVVVGRVPPNGYGTPDQQRSDLETIATNAAHRFQDKAGVGTSVQMLMHPFKFRNATSEGVKYAVRRYLETP